MSPSPYSAAAVGDLDCMVFFLLAMTHKPSKNALGSGS